SNARPTWNEINKRMWMRLGGQVGWRMHWILLVREWSGAGAISVPGSQWRDHQSAATVAELLACELALRGYFLERGVYPEKLEDLVPLYLSEAPVDPCSATSDGPIYRRTIQDYTLYSRGYDGDDDNGQPPIPTYADWDPTEEWIDWTADGDLSLKEYFKEE